MSTFDVEIAENILIEFFNDKDITGETDLLIANKIDSISVIDLTLYVEDKFGLEIYMEEITRENFSTIAKIVNFLKQKSSSVT